MARASPEWNLDSDEIASVTSQDLHDNRPNRWAGPASTWRDFTKEERYLWRSMKQLEDRDLAVHLYNAHALKRRGRDPETAQDVTVTMDNGQEGIWAPPKVWTAWPLSAKRPSSDRPAAGKDIYGNRGIGDDGGDPIYRLREKRMASSDLQEELSATVLRMAKERFYRERASATGQSGSESPGDDSDADDEVEDDDSDDDDDDDDGTKGKAKAGFQSDKMDVESDQDANIKAQQPSQSMTESRKRKAPRTFTPMPSINDDHSYHLLRQPVRHILTQLDNTLRILHNARVATTDYASDSSATSDESSDSQPGTPRRRGRPRSALRQRDRDRDRDQDPTTSISNGNGYSSASQTDTTSGGRKRGRPKKIRIPRDGESHEEMLIRIARENHKRLPATNADKDASFEAWLRAGDERPVPGSHNDEPPTQQTEPPLPPPPPPARAQRRGTEEAGVVSEDEKHQQQQDHQEARGRGPSTAPPSHRKTKQRSLGLRSWSDVVGAAALAGFSPHVIALTTRRCAALFRESMTIRHLHETPSSARHPAFHSTDYHPEPIHLFDHHASDASDDTSINSTSPNDLPSDHGSEISLRPPSSRQPSNEPRRGRPTTASPSPSRSRSLSRSSAGCYLCPIPSCERAITGFSRRPNLRRHMRLVHPGQEGEEEQDSEDEVFGAVHVDGFLRPILPSRGWREPFPYSPRVRGDAAPATAAAAAAAAARGAAGLKKSVSPLPFPPPVASTARRAPQRSPSFSLSEDD